QLTIHPDLAVAVFHRHEGSLCRVSEFYEPNTGPLVIAQPSRQTPRLRGFATGTAPVHSASSAVDFDSVVSKATSQSDQPGGVYEFHRSQVFRTGTRRRRAVRAGSTGAGHHGLFAQRHVGPGN